MNGAQRTIIVIGMGIGLYLFGQWLIGSWQGGSFGWVGYAPLSDAPAPPHVILHPWVRLLVWLVLTTVWVLASLAVMSPRSAAIGKDDSGGTAT